MSVSGILSSLYNYGTQATQNKMTQFKAEFQQLGQDLQSGSLSAAQSDFAALQLLGPQASSTSPAQSGNAIGQDFTQLAKDLKAGNTSAAQQDYAKIQQDLQSQLGKMHHHHHHAGGGGTETIGSLMSQLGQDLQSGALTSAQQTYNTLQQDFQMFAQGSGSSTASSGSISVSA
jgi:hypothetical protein